MNSMMWLDANDLQTNINDKYQKKKKKLLIHRTMITKDWEWTMISLAQQIHRSHIIGNQDHQIFYIFIVAISWKLLVMDL